MIVIWMKIFKRCCSISSHFNPTFLLANDLFFKLICHVWMLQCAISQTTYFLVCYSGSLCFVLYGITLSDECAKYCRKYALIYTFVAWVVYILNFFFMFYSMFLTGGYLDILIAPFFTYINVSDLLIPRIMMYLFTIYLNASWIFPHAMGLMLATIFTCQYKRLGQTFNRTLRRCDERRLSDSDVETFRQRHQDISMNLKQADDFLMFHHAGAFCCQLFIVILLLYVLIFFRSCAEDPLVVMMHIFWLLGTTFGLTVTTAGGIMVNHYVSTNSVYLRSCVSVWPCTMNRYLNCRICKVWQLLQLTNFSKFKEKINIFSIISNSCNTLLP